MGMGGSSGLFAPPPLWAAEQQMGIGGLTPPTSFSGGLDQAGAGSTSAPPGSGSGAGPGAANGFHHSLFPFQLPGEASAGEPAHPPPIGAGGGKPPRAGGPGMGICMGMGMGVGAGGVAATGGAADPFNSTESLARLLGLSLPETPDSLAAQARAHGGHPHQPGAAPMVGGSRYAFATEGGDPAMRGYPGDAGAGVSGGPCAACAGRRRIRPALA